MSVNCGKSRKYDIYVKRFYENVIFHPVVNLLCHKFILRKLILPFLSLVMEINLSLIEVAYSNIQSKTKINGLLSDFFYPYIRSLPWGSHIHTVIYYCG